MVQDSDPYDVVVVGAGVVGIIVAAKIAQKGVRLRTKGRLRVALMERGPYLKGTPRPGYGHPLRRRMFTNVMSEFREGRRYLMEVPQGPGGTYGYPIPAASTVGGGSLHYGAETRDPHAVDYLAWQDETGVDWTEARMQSAGQEIHRMSSIHERPRQLVGQFCLEFGQAGRDLGFEVHPTYVAKRNCSVCSSATTSPPVGTSP